MTRDEMLDLYALVQTRDGREEPTDADELVWARILGQLSVDDCADAIIAHFREQPNVWLQPGHILARVRARRADELARMDPDERGAELAATRDTRRDRHGYIDRSAPEDDEYPPEWTAQQRVGAYWQRIQELRDMGEYEQAISRPGTLSRQRPASAAQRAKAMAAVAAQYSFDDVDDDAPYVNPLSVRCEFCQSPQGEACTMAGMPGQPREKRQRAHPGRLEAAARAAGMDEHAVRAIVDASAKAALNGARQRWPVNVTGYRETPAEGRTAPGIAAQAAPR
jgi:hypothetical protein